MANPSRTNTIHHHRNNRNNSVRNPHYENIYESIDHFATVNAAGPADAPQNSHNRPVGAVNHTDSLRTRNQTQRNASSSSSSSTLTYPRNGAAYDIPRQAIRSNNYYATNNRRLNIDANRIRYMNTNRSNRQRCFDDTESNHYAHGHNWRYENIYEQIHEEPIYRNNNRFMNRGVNANRVYGRLFHGIGRIERHLSSSCGNLERLNLGGTYAILGHSHLGTVGHIRLNAANAANNTKESAGKSLNFFSCLGRENSQSMSNICRDANNGNIAEAQPSAAAAHERPPQNENTVKHTGAIPKVRNQQNAAQNNVAPMHTTTLNRMSKSSLHWLLMNKWLPLWYYGDGSECNVLDFNFMFSRNCEGCINDSMRRQQKRLLNGTANDERYANGYERRDPAENQWHFNNDDNNSFQFGEPDVFQRTQRVNVCAHPAHYNGHEAENFDENSLSRSFQRVPPHAENPFRRWELNSENNSFRPASVRRITDGTFPHSAPNQTVRIDVEQNVNQAVPSTSRQNDDAIGESSSQQSKSQSDFGQAAACSSTESSSENENKIFSPNLSARRYSENTEDDQYNTSNSSTITDGEDSDASQSESPTTSSGGTKKTD